MEWRSRKYCRNVTWVHKQSFPKVTLTRNSQLMFFLRPLLKKEKSIVFAHQLLPLSLLPKPLPVLYFCRSKPLRAPYSASFFSYKMICQVNTVFTSFGWLHHISFLVLDKVLWPGLLGPVIQLTYVVEYDIAKALTSDVRIARLAALNWTWTSIEHLKGVSLWHSLINRVSFVTLVSSGLSNHQRCHKEGTDKKYFLLEPFYYCLCEGRKGIFSRDT